MANLLFYENPVALSKVDHKNTRIKPLQNNYRFAAKTNSVILAGVEFTEAAKEYPVVFTQSGDHVVPVALLGLRNEENLYIKADGTWDAKYVPAFVRRYPFVLADTGEGDQRVVCIDSDFSGFSETEGEPLFEGDQPTPVLQQALDFLDEYQKQYARTERFVQRLRDNDLLMSLNAKVDMVDGAQYALTGLMAVDEKKLLQLDDAVALEFFKSGELAWVYCHLMSLGTMGSMVERIARLTKAVKPEVKQPESPAAKTAGNASAGKAAATAAAATAAAPKPKAGGATTATKSNPAKKPGQENSK